ncbi:transcription initiation factor TFIID subunit 11 [Coemansia sp. Benny D160-2]|nr:transcription initiation factor TFIID subunit 11 [Coemansia sp. Benny D160-2]
MSDQPRNSGPSSSGSTPTSTAKKRQRLTALTPAGLLRQRKRRGSSTSGGGGGNNGRTPGSSRPGTPTPTKLRASMSQGSLAWQDSATSGPERRGSFGGGRRGSTLGLTSSVAGTESASSRHGSLVHPRTASMHEAAAGGGDAVQQRRGGRQRVSSVGGAGLAAGSGPNETADHEDNDDGNDDDDDANAAEGADGLTLVRQSKEEVKELWDQMSDEQKQRYGVYLRTALNKGAMKKLVTSILNQQVSPTITFVVAGFAKVFVGEIVERALEVQRERGEENDGPLTPEHLREAYRLYKKESQIPLSGGSGSNKRLF